MMRTKSLTRISLALAVLAATLVVVAPVSAQEEQEEQEQEAQTQVCEPMVDYAFKDETNATVAPDEIEAGSNITVVFTVQACSETALSVVTYTAGSLTGLAEGGVGGVFDQETEVVANGTVEVTITVPPCSFRLDLFAGQAAEAVANGTSLDVSAEALATIEGGIGLCVPEVDVQVSCPTLKAKANGDGSITLSIDAAAEAGALLLYRAAGDEEMEVLALLEGTSYVDTETEVGTTYSYAVVAVLGEVEESCGVVEVTSIPVFPGAVGMVAAVALGGLGYVVTRRR